MKKLLIVLICLMLSVIIAGCIGQGDGTGNSTINKCENLSNYPVDKAHCYSDVALKQNNPLLCEDLGEMGYKGVCYFDIGSKTGDVSVCDNLEGALGVYVCYKDVAIALKNPAICEKIVPAPGVTEFNLEYLQTSCIEGAS
ncbi:MAG: hypothetical protein ABIG20_01090 [archaeon]